MLIEQLNRFSKLVKLKIEENQCIYIYLKKLNMYKDEILLKIMFEIIVESNKSCL